MLSLPIGKWSRQPTYSTCTDDPGQELKTLTRQPSTLLRLNLFRSLSSGVSLPSLLLVRDNHEHGALLYRLRNDMVRAERLSSIVTHCFRGTHHMPRPTRSAVGLSHTCIRWILCMTTTAAMANLRANPRLIIRQSTSWL